MTFGFEYFPMNIAPFKLFSLHGKAKILHLNWLAFFISFVIWFNHAPLLMLIQQDLALSDTEIEIILLLNVALTIPARVITGLLVDRLGARISYSVLLAVCSLPCFLFAMADTFAELAWARFLLGFIGAGFVIGVRIIGDWFPSSQMGFAEGIYAGWGNFGSAAAAIVLPGFVWYLGSENGWRYAVAVTGCLALLFSVVYYRAIENLPPELARLQVKHANSMEVSSIQDLFLYMLSLLPLYASLSLLTWKLSILPYPLLSTLWSVLLHASIWLLFLWHAHKLVITNANRLSQPVPEIHRYRYKQVFILAISYFITFGSKLAVLSMLPMFFFNTFKDSQHISMLDAGLLTSSFVITNVIARPAGGWLSDRLGRRLSIMTFTAGLGLGYFLMGQITRDHPMSLVILITLVCAVFLQAAEGAVFAFVPLIRRAITGEVAGIIGAYGNAGAIFFLIALTFLTPSGFFLLLGTLCLVSLGLLIHLVEPKDFMTQILPDGTVIKIELE